MTIAFAAQTTYYSRINHGQTALIRNTAIVAWVCSIVGTIIWILTHWVHYKAYGWYCLLGLPSTDQDAKDRSYLHFAIADGGYGSIVERLERETENYEAGIQQITTRSMMLQIAHFIQDLINTSRFTCGAPKRVLAASLGVR